MQKSVSASSILLAEDEYLIVEMLQGALQEAGFDIVCARNGDQATKEIEEDVGRFVGIITDAHLAAGPDGWHIARRARELAPAIPVIYITGAAAAEWACHGVPNSVLITKPFVPAQVITAIAGLMNQGDVC
ncbi:response regulator [Alsobacter sp. KACC 23698]|uniref:Response regulator n=1 Tax=Alsobacter sp. KACC 23698 TaxID=3149229 RepID=A0AAU7JCM2_9HYPH